ncbi:hypothetical protein GA0111570_102227 [Raineyella antarctica]|uniref:Uncharacterized protein n=1 Tax=Raineyella antarctica TaxID=1577474 RepID=A0A1G6GEM6_9ACTN|nr:hypothetical protein GA0111570_102227 [Raineyella antarctica]
MPGPMTPQNGDQDPPRTVCTVGSLGFPGSVVDSRALGVKVVGCKVEGIGHNASMRMRASSPVRVGTSLFTDLLFTDDAGDIAGTPVLGASLIRAA